MLPWTEAIPFVIVAPSVLVGGVLRGEVTPTVLEVVRGDAVEGKTQNST